MKKRIFPALAFLLGIGLCSQAANAADCSGSWTVLPNRDSRMAPCTQLGLDTHRGVCQPGQAYETLCDDAKGGRYRICQGPRPCGNSFAPPPVQSRPPCTSWDNVYNRPCPPGYVNDDCRGNCSPAQQLTPPTQAVPPCSSWDYDRNRPCPPGYINHDCQGDCGPAQ